MISDEDLEVLAISMDVVRKRAGVEAGPSCIGRPTPLMLLPAIYDAPEELRAPAAQAVMDLVAEVMSYRRAARLVGAGHGR